MKKLAKREEDIMQVLWRLEAAFVKEIIEALPLNHKGEKPHYNTVSTLIRILKDKGFVGHKAVGGSHQYYPIVDREDYLSQVLQGYYGNSLKGLVAHFAKEEKISPEELEEILEMIKNKDSQK
ncbi:MAG: BlaI/MecI/CopY family transcriptional regulator [Bacteroidota bacterium]